MLKNISKRKKKKGFTLIELVIVLAVLAIIALIAIPNFTKVRNDSLSKADTQTAEQIKNITLMAIANGDIPPTPATYTIKFSSGTANVASASADYNAMLKEVNKAQVNGEENFDVEVYGTGTDVGSVRVSYTGGATLTE